jgi:hypothetical protein
VLLGDLLRVSVQTKGSAACLTNNGGGLPFAMVSVPSGPLSSPYDVPRESDETLKKQVSVCMLKVTLGARDFRVRRGWVYVLESRSIAADPFRMDFSGRVGVTGVAVDRLGYGFAGRIAVDVIDVWNESVPAPEEVKENCAGDSEGRTTEIISRGVFIGALDVAVIVLCRWAPYVWLMVWFNGAGSIPRRR